MNHEEARVLASKLIPSNVSPVTLSSLENYLADAANLLRGSIDQADFKAYIFPLMFFKRISDVYLEEYGEALAEAGGDHEFASFRENHRFDIPEGALWEDVRARTENIGTALQTAFREIEKANPEHPVRDLRQCELDQQGQAAGRQAGRPHRALLRRRRTNAPWLPTSSATPTST